MVLPHNEHCIRDQHHRSSLHMMTKRAVRKISGLKTHQHSLDAEIEELRSKYGFISSEEGALKSFNEFPLSQKTLKALREYKFLEPTGIQRKSIGPALQGKDVLGAAITGSGKTLAFLIPVLEHLFVAKWSRVDGVAAIIISPTRELAYQIFETLKKVGKYHDFSAGLIIGGKNLKFERTRMDQCNILICTPGRLLQHMDENPLFNASTMEILVLDEADRCLDMGFEQSLNAIIENLPLERQTLLFSATQTNSVKDLARLNLRNPIYIGQAGVDSVDGIAKEPIVPDLLQQSYVVIALEHKITMLWSFIKNHLKQKIIVFLSSCKQVKYIYEIFCKLRPGTSLLGLYGTLHQDRRIAIYNDFLKKSNVVLFATDIASRGLDFPSVNWVVQLDCPEDVTQYIHRAGRSARNKKRGESLLVLMPSEEEGMTEELQRININIRRIQIDPKKMFSPRSKIEAFLAANPELKSTAQRAFVAYIKSVLLLKNKKIFNVHALNLDEYAKSLGLAVTPRVRFLERFLKKQPAHSRTNEKCVSDGDLKSGDEQVVDKNKGNPQGLLFTGHKSESESDDDFLKIKRVNHDIKCKTTIAYEDLPPAVMRKKEKHVTKASLAKRALKKNIQVNEKHKFDEEGREISDTRKQLQSELAKEYEMKSEAMGGINIELAKQLLQEEDKYDKLRFRKLIKQKHRNIKEKFKKKDENAETEQSDTEDSVDLTWLPDPSKIYKDNSESQKSEKDCEDSLRKRKLKTKVAEERGLTSDEETNIDSDHIQPIKKKPNITSKLTLDDAEIIAAQLLANAM